MTTIAFDIASFRAMFKAFASVTAYPDAMLNLYWGAASQYISADDSPCYRLTGATRELALQQMTAHLLALGQKANAGQFVGPVENAKVDKVDVKLAQRPAPNMWQWWLSSTPYGLMLLGLLQIASAGGFFVGGLPEGSAFRKVGGVF